MDINDLFEGIAEAFRQYQAEIVEQEQASSNLDPTGHGADTEAEKTEKEGNREENRRKFSETGVNAEHSNECYSSA
jgi:hypothetical protein